MLKQNKTRVLGGFSKAPTLPLSRADSSIAATKDAGNKKGDGSTGNTETDSPDDNIITSRLRQEGLLPSFLPDAKAGASDKVTPNKKTLPSSTPSPSGSGIVTLPSDVKLARFRQQVTAALGSQAATSDPPATAQKGSIVEPFPKTPLITAGRTDQKVPQAKPSPSSGVLTSAPEVAQLAELVAKLPSEFPVDEWDSMTSQQRLLAVRSSGLTQQEQWQLLNASGSLSTIAAIQDIQSNYRTYGLSAQAVDKLTTDLLTIDNARTSAKNHEMPFATDMQRGLFLSQLDKEEQKLLDPVDRQKESGRGTLMSKEQMPSSDEPRKTPVPQVITEIDNNSKLASVAKAALKGYLGIRYMLPTTLTMLSLEELCKLIDHGTISIGVSGTAIWLGGGSKNVGLVMDTSGDIGVITTYGGYAGTPSLSYTAFASISNADRINNLSGQVFEIGGSGGEVVSVGGEVATFVDETTGKTSLAVNLNVGLGITPPGLPGEGHSGLSTSVVERVFNIFDAWTEFAEGYIAW